MTACAQCGSAHIGFTALGLTFCCRVCASDWFNAHEPPAQEAWRAHCLKLAQAEWAAFAAEHPKVVDNPKPGYAEPPIDTATPAMFERYLEARTGLRGWRASISGSTMLVEPPEPPRNSLAFGSVKETT